MYHFDKSPYLVNYLIISFNFMIDYTFLTHYILTAEVIFQAKLLNFEFTFQFLRPECN